MAEQIKAIIKDVRYFSGGFLIATAKVAGNSSSSFRECVLKGNWIVLDDADPTELPVSDFGVEFLFLGKSSYNSKWNQHEFSFSSYCPVEPTDPAAIVTYILKYCPGTGIGPQKLRTIVSKYGDKVLEVLRNDWQPLCEEMGLNPLAMEAMSERLNDQKHFEDQLIKVIHYLDGYGVPHSTIMSFVENNKLSSMSKLSDNAFVLMDYPGVGFRRCDSIFLDKGGNPGDIRRQMYAGLHGMKEDRSGSVWLEKSIFTKGIRENVHPELVDIAAAASLAKEENRIIIVKDSNDKQWVALADDAIAEMRFSEHINRLSKNVQEWPDASVLGNATDHQRENFISSITGSMAIMTGLAGSGKTYITKPIINWAAKKFGLNQVAAVALSGKASVRIREIMTSGSNPINIPCSTIHSLLGFNGFSFAFNKSNKLSLRFLIIDEVSMLGCSLLSDLLDAVPDNCLVYFTGDPLNQLPPIERGAPVRDLMASKIVNYGYLTEIHRYSGRSNFICSDIVSGKRPLFPSRIDLKATPADNIVFIKRQAGEIANTVFKVCQQLIERGHEYLGSSIPIDFHAQCQIIAAVNSKSPASIESLNKMIGEMVNESPAVEGTPFRDGDKVICLSNCSLPSVQKGSQHEIYNGDIGKVLLSEKSKMIVRFNSPERTVIVTRSSKKNNEPGCNLNLGWAVTCHKCQGSGIDIPVIVLDPSYQARSLICRNWLNTAITRMQKFCIVIGTQETLDNAIRNSVIEKRKTFLPEIISGLNGEAKIHHPLLENIL